MSPEAENRRNFHRIFFDADASITSGEESYTSRLIDLSLNGALVRAPTNWQPETGDDVRLTLKLGADGIDIVMETSVTHTEVDTVGLKMVNIDMDSISHLRRLVELNLGDSEMLHRDLEHLVDPKI